MKSFTAVPAKQNNSSKSGVMSIINPATNTRRITFRKSLLEKIGFEEGDLLQLMYDEEKGYICVGVYPIWGQENQGYRLTGYPKAPAIYNTDLVKEMTSIFQLDYSDRTSLTFEKVFYKTGKRSGKPYAKVMVR